MVGLIVPLTGSLAASSGGASPSTLTLDPATMDLGTDASLVAELSGSRLTGVRVALEGDIAAVAAVSTPLGWDGGGCGGGVGEVLELTVSRTGGVSGQTYEGFLAVTDDTGAVTRFDVSLEAPSSLSEIAQQQGWDFVWDMAAAGTSQPNEGSGAATALTLGQARATTTQAGALGRFPLVTDTSDRAQSAATIAMGVGAKSVVVCLEITDTTASRAVWSGGPANGNNFGFIAIGSGGDIEFQGHGLGTVCSMATASTGVWLLAASSDALGNVTAWARKIGGARQDSSGARGVTLGGDTTQTLGGDGSVYFSVEGNYFFAALRTGAEMTSAEFDALFSALS